MSLSSSPFKFLAALAAALVPVALTGCAGMVTTASDTNAFSVAGTTSGQLHGGNQPVSGSTVKLYAVGTTGYGSAGTLLATTTSANDGYGSFSFSQVTSGATGPAGSSYVCPTSNTLIYIIASGGNTVGTGNNNNSAAVFLAALGACSTSANGFFDVNEVSTAASVAALAQYINPGTSTPGSATIGSPNTAQAKVGLTNAFATIPNLINVATGTALSTLTLTGTNPSVSGTTVTVTPETGKINSIANVLTACVNNATSAGAGCTTLFSNATPPSPALTSQPAATFNTAVDTLQANYYMATNPTDGSTANLTNLYNLTAAVAPFQPALTAQPTDWTVGLLYNAGTSTCTGAASGKFIFYAYQVRSDAGGNIWISSNGPVVGGSQTVPENISQVSPTGVPMACVTPSATGGVYTGLTIDTSGNVWAASHAGGIYKINSSTLSVTPWSEVGLTPWAIEADGSGNVFYTIASAPVHKFAGAATASTAAPSVAIGTESSAFPNFMTIDVAGNIWVPETTASGNLFENYPDAVTGTNGYSTSNAGVAGNVQAQIAIDASGKVWTTQTTPANTATVFTPQTPPSAATSTATAAGLGGISTPRGVVIDGAGNAWIPNGVSGGHNVAELDKNLNSLSGTTGFVKATVLPNTLRSVTIDPSGNVWIGTNATTVDTISEIVGAAVPVITPLSAQLASGTAATKP